MAKYTVIIGRSEEIDVVGTAMGIPAKIDTGAYRSSIHASDIKVTKNKEGVAELKYNLLGHPCSPVKRPMATTDFAVVTVRSSTGHEQERYEVKLKVKLGNKVFTTSFSLSDRTNNVFPVLIGRKTMQNRYLVDVSKTNVNRQQLLKDFGVTEPRDEEDLED